MSLDSGVSPPIPYTPLRRRSIDIHGVIIQLDDDVLEIRMGIWRRVVFLVWAGSIGGCCAPFLIFLHSSLTIENYRLSREVMPFAWAAVAIAFGLLVLTVGVLFLSPIRFDRSQGSVGRGGWVPGWWERDLNDVLAIQICQGKADVTYGDRSRDTKITPIYQLNLVFDDRPPTRRNVIEDKDRRKIVLAARQIADFLGKPILNYLGSKPGTLDKVDDDACRLLAARRSGENKISTALCLTSVVALLITCCGCPPIPPSQDEQRTGVSSRWITVEPSAEVSGSKLSVQDAEAITAQVPVLSEIVIERVRSTTLQSESSQAAAVISGTGPSYLRLLKETTRAELTAGRFLEAADTETASTVIVLDEKLAEKLFVETDPIGRSVSIGQQTWTVIGVVTQPRSRRNSDLTKDAYLPREAFSAQPSEATEESPESLDRIRVRVDSLDQVDNVQVALEAIINKRHPNLTFMVR